jgi:uncharacterized protein
MTRGLRASDEFLHVMKFVLSFGTVALAIWVVLSALMYFAQDRFLYFPSPEVNRPGARVLRLPTKNATVKVWELHPEARPAVIYFGGNGEDVGVNIPEFDRRFPDRAFYLVNYRGYGGSTGVPREGALIADAAAVYDWVRARHDSIVVMGRSLGTGVATALASRRPVAGLVLVTPYDSIANVAAGRYSWLPVRWLIKDPYNSVPRMRQVRAPVLVFVAGRDQSIPRARSEALIAAIPAGLGHTVMVPAAGHNDIENFPAYWAALKAFFTP